MKTRRIVKDVSWGYPTSTNAARFGFARVGCWTVGLTHFTKNHRGEDCAVTVAHSAFATQGEAYDQAKALPHEWASWVRKANEAIEAARVGDASTPYTV